MPRLTLSEVAPVASFVAVRDGVFASLGKARHGTPELLVFVEKRRYMGEVKANPQISCVITTPALAGETPPHLGVATSDLPREAFYALHHYLATQTDFYWQDFETQIAEGAEIHPLSHVAAKNVMIGKGTRIEPGAIVQERTIIGQDVIIRAGAVIGSEGFETAHSQGHLVSVIHAGGVRIGDRVEVQCNCCVDRPIFGAFTVIGEETKIDNLVHIAHNVQIGHRCRLAAGAVIAGNVALGNDVWVGPRVVTSNGITVGDGAKLSLGSVVVQDVQAGERVTGNFAVEHYRFLDHMSGIWSPTTHFI